MARNDIVIQALERMRVRIVQNLETTGTNASGRTSASLRVVPTDKGAMLVGRSFFRGVEDGRPGGRVPYNFQAIIRQWIIDKKIPVTPKPYIRPPAEPKYSSAEERGLDYMAGAIAHSIQRRGTVLYRNGGRRDIFSNVLGRDGYIGGEGEDILKEMKSSLKNNIIEGFKNIFAKLRKKN